MKKRTILSLASAVSLLVAFGPGVYGQTVNIDRITTPTNNANGTPNYGGDTPPGVVSTNEGGEFTVIPTDTTLLSNYVLGPGSSTSTGTRVTDPDTGLVGQVGFQTFCLELKVTINSLPTGPLPYTISPTVLNGQTNPLTVGTAYLYSKFAQGILSGYDYVDIGQSFTSSGETSPRGTDAAYLQAAIWYLQGDVTLTNADGLSNVYLQDLITAGLLSSNGLSGTALSSATADEFGVEVLNLGSPANNYNFQAMLVYQKTSITTPDGGATLAMLGLGLGGLGFLRRRFLA